MAILGFVLLVGVAIYFVFFYEQRGQTFTRSEWDAFRRAEQVKNDLKEVQRLVGPAKPDVSFNVGAFLPKPPQPPSDDKK